MFWFSPIKPSVPKALNAIIKVLFEGKAGPVDQSGMIAAFATRKPRVQIPFLLDFEHGEYLGMPFHNFARLVTQFRQVYLDKPL